MEAVITLGKKLQEYQTQFSTTRLLVLCDYFQNTLLRHHQLYQFVLGHDQDVRLSVEHVEVSVPPQPLALTQGTEEAVWAHEQQLAKLALDEAQKRVDLLVWKEVQRLEKEQRLRTVFSGRQSGNQQLCREVGTPTCQPFLPYWTRALREVEAGLWVVTLLQSALSFSGMKKLHCCHQAGLSVEADASLNPKTMFLTL